MKFASDDSLEAQIAAFRLREGRPPPNSATGPLVAPESIQDSESLDRLDFFRAYPATVPSSHHKFFIEFDWAATELGPISSWCTSLRRKVTFLMSDPRPAAMFWGKQRTMMYNEPYMHVTGQKHPGMMGKIFSEAWGEIEGDFIPAFEKAYSTGASTVLDDARFYIERHGYLEETYYSIAMIPFLGDDDEIAFYNPVFDTTRQVISDRRMAFLLRSGQYISSSRDPQDFWQQLIFSLQADHPDLPYAVLYSVNGDVSESVSEASDNSQNRNWTLHGRIRIPDTCSDIPIAATDQSMELFLPTFSELVKSESPTLLRAGDGSLPHFITQHMAAQNGETEQSAVFLPIRSTADNLLGFLVLGLNPRRRFDADYRVFIELLTRQLATSLASAVLFEEEIRRAARDRKILTKKLALQTHEALENESRFRRMADLAPVGMYHIEPNGLIIYCNENYHELTGHSRSFAPMVWLDVLFEDDLPLMTQEWAKLLAGESVNFEIRLRRPFFAEDLIDGERVEGHTWLLAAAYPERANDGTVVGILGCITDISRQKWMEGFQKRKMLDAIELKRQQENFIDMTSHEMRNPLSAIVQCADWISTSLSEFDCDQNEVIIPRDVMDGYADATETIVLCAQHQKRIIDDVLTLSKLDSDLLIITPIDVQPISTIQASLKMFDVEVQNNDIDLRFQVDDSYSQLAVDWVKLDPSRLLQVLINLVTNAIKFTTTESRRRIVIKLGASHEPPPTSSSIEYLPRTTNRRDMTRGSAWGTGEHVYLHVEVQDSGRGLDDVERTLLFKRFSQTSPRTHVQYGGSGLGLFICRQLTELQGGQIGVTSSVGVGSTFAFYVRARRCLRPTAAQHTPSSANRLDLPRVMSLDVLENLRSSTLQQSKLYTPKHVLVVEDNIVNQKVLSRQLQSAGCIVSVANHGREALAFLEKSRFWKGLEITGVDLSIVLMDLEMPVMDGLTCVKMIRKLQGEGQILGHVPVIAVTANARSEQISTAKESGMDSVVTKPFRIPDLLPEMDKQIKNGLERGLERSVSIPA
ncbi:putative histidine kinase M3YPp [Leptodontidium sp. MPI-SDFR-AT-0119]|nr:putative histidine kinase M3YPp [Leptodontidium sp. MPI-SDFR-AT-0119]